MSRALLALPPLLLAAAVVAALAGACQDLATGVPCYDIPAGGCPPDRGGTCDDPTCAALYDCVDGHWTLSQLCPGPDGGPRPDGGPDGGPGLDGGCTPVTVDAGAAGFDCMPDLAFPDCPFAAAGCAGSACLTGCSDFFVCAQGPCAGGPGPCWIDVAYCDEGDLIVTSP